MPVQPMQRRCVFGWRVVCRLMFADRLHCAGRYYFINERCSLLRVVPCGGDLIRVWDGLCCLLPLAICGAVLLRGGVQRSGGHFWINWIPPCRGKCCSRENSWSWCLALFLIRYWRLMDAFACFWIEIMLRLRCCCISGPARVRPRPAVFFVLLCTSITAGNNVWISLLFSHC